MKLIGKVKSGYGNASFWVEKVNKIFEKKYEMNLFLGTLNIELDKPYVLDDTEKILPNEYGGQYEVLVKEAKLNNHKVYILRTEKNNTVNGDHPLNIIEIVANMSLRKTENLKDGDEVIIKLK